MTTGEGNIYVYLLVPTNGSLSSVSVCWSRYIKMNDYYLQRRLLTNFTKCFVMFAQKYFAGLARAENIGMVSEGVNERNTSLRKTETS